MNGQKNIKIYIYIYIYISKYFISTATCFSASAPFSGSLNFVLVRVTNN